MHVLISEKLPIKVWTGNADEDYDAPVFDQFRNLANHPLAYKYICAMPDAHLGYGMPIGGVLATQGGVVPNAVGVDIGCGMIAVRTNVQADALSREVLRVMQLAIYDRVPVGFKHHEKTQNLPEHKLFQAEGLLPVVSQHYERAKYQLGTLGGGNHFIELQRCVEDGRLWIMLHSGSRNIGKQVCDHYHKVAKKYMVAFHVDVEADLAFLPTSVPEYDLYLAEMHWCMKFAEANRKAMLEATYAALLSCDLAFEVDITVDTHHNFVAMEEHFGEYLMIHRKGAVKATGLVTIPGSMETYSYVGEGLTPTESFNTCAHGAGRRMGRKEANRTITYEEAVAAMEHVVYNVRQGDYDELGRCYKDLDAVMEAQADLVKPLYRLTPLTVVKG